MQGGGHTFKCIETVPSTDKQIRTNSKAHLWRKQQRGYSFTFENYLRTRNSYDLFLPQGYFQRFTNIEMLNSILIECQDFICQLRRSYWVPDKIDKNRKAAEYKWTNGREHLFIFNLSCTGRRRVQTNYWKENFTYLQWTSFENRGFSSSRQSGTEVL